MMITCLRIDDCICVPVDGAITGKAVKLVVLKSDIELYTKAILSYLAT